MSLTFALASKFIAITGALVTGVRVIADSKAKLSKRLLIILLLGITASTCFILVQPRMWFDPLARLYEALEVDAIHLSSGHPVPIGSLPGGDGSWQDPRVFPPWWLMIYWATLTASPFQLIGMTCLICSIRKSGINGLSFERAFPIIAFVVPLIYLSVQSVKLPQFLTFLSLGLTLIAVLGYQTTLAMNRLVLPLSMTTILNPIEETIFRHEYGPVLSYSYAGGFIQSSMPLLRIILTPFWLRFLQWLAVAFIIVVLIGLKQKSISTVSFTRRSANSGLQSTVEESSRIRFGFAQ